MTAAKPHTAEAILLRLLVVLPEAARTGEGVRLDPLAEELGVEPKRILADLEELESRSYYLPPGLGDQFQLIVTRDRLTVWTTGEFQRPVRLTPREALALELGLRVVATAAREEDRSEFEELRERIVFQLRTPEPGNEEDPEVVLAGVETGEDHLQLLIERAVRDRRQLRILYRRPGQDPSGRVIAPLLMVHAEGKWYLLARDLDLQAVRAFRLDRILQVEATGASFEPEVGDEAELERFLRDGRVHDGGGGVSGNDEGKPFEAVVRYSEAIARWARERGWEEVEEEAGGALRARHRVTDPEWLIRHVLHYAGEARVVEPEWLRRRIGKAAEELIYGAHE